MKKFAVAAVFVLIIALCASLGWIAGTESGTRWLLTTVPSLVGIDVSVQKIEGKISGHLILTQVRLSLPHQKVELDRVELRWKPLLLLTGTAAFQELIIAGARIQDDSLPDNNKPLSLVWPRVPQAAQLLDGIIMHLRVTNLSYRYQQEQPLLITLFDSSVTWHGAVLSLKNLKLESPLCSIQGDLLTGLDRPSLAADLAIALSKPIAEMDHFTLRVQENNRTGAEQLAGTIAIAASAGTRKLLLLEGEAGLERTVINLRKLSLTRPGRRGVLNAEGTLAIAREVAMSLQVKASDLDLTPELKMPTNLSGTLTFKGTTDSYRGELSIANQAGGWHKAEATAVYNGTRTGLKMAPFNARLLDGSLDGNLDMDWGSGFSLRGALKGRNLNPARFDPGWKGVVNFNTEGQLAWSGKTPLTGNISGSLLESSLHGQALTGELQADFSDNNLSLERLKLQGKGFDLHASGELNQRVDLSATVTDLSRLVPGAAGTLQSKAWLRWRNSSLSGAATASVNKFAYAGTRVASANLSAQLEQGANYPMHVAVSMRDTVYGAYSFSSVKLAADGTIPQHTLSATLRSAGSEAQISLSAGYGDGVWSGTLTHLTGSDGNGPWNLQAPASFSVSAGKFSLSPLVLSGGASERIEATADLVLNPLKGKIQVKWDGLNLSRANPYLKDRKISGNSSGSLQLGFLPDNRITATGSISSSGTFAEQGHSITLLRSRLTFNGGEQGLLGALEFTTATGGSLKGTFSSSSPLQLALPEKGKLEAEVKGIDLILIKPWLPAETRLDGFVSGHLQGVMLPGQRFELDGNAVLSGGVLHQQRPDGELKFSFSNASSTFSWRGELLTGTLDMVMAEHGRANLKFQLPIAARLPTAINPSGPLRASLSGHFQEKGLVTVLFPGLVQESSGEIDANLVIGGTWGEPGITGTMRLEKAGAYLPAAGIQLKDVQLSVRLEKDLIRIESFRAVSGAGNINGTAQITLAGWKMAGYQGTIGGENFQTVNFPELQIVVSPKLSFEGTPQKLTVRGDLQLPELTIINAISSTEITPSSDVIQEGKVLPSGTSSAMVYDIQVRVLLGDKDTVKISGIDAKLGGAVNLSFSSLDRIISSGEIKVVNGRYRTYGVNLEIVRGRLFFAGTPIDTPSLDFLALRTIGDIKAGVTVTGTLQNPVTKLYSEPAMPDVDVLAYIVLGHPLGSSGEKVSLMNQAAGALLSSSQASNLQNRIKEQLGLSTLEVQSGVGGTSNAMGYKPLQVTPPGAIAATQQSGITETVLTVGKYLTPQLYLSYGKSVFTGSSLFRLRYDIFKHWQIETQTGSESGVDLYYKLEFL